MTSSSLSLVACRAEVHSGEPWRLKAGLTIHSSPSASELLTHTLQHTTEHARAGQYSQARGCSVEHEDVFMSP